MIQEVSAAGQASGPYHFSIRGTDTDWQDKLHWSSLFSFMQESAYANAEAGGFGSTLLDGLDLCWILIRIAVRMDRLPRWGETVTVSTWSRGCRKLTWLRDYEFFDEAGNMLGIASSEWLVASTVDHRPQRPDVILNGRELPRDVRSVFAEPMTRLPQLDERAAELPILTIYADYSDIDRNGHVNNTRYAAWCMNTIHAYRRTAGQPEAAGLSGLEIHFISEARIGDKIHCHCQPDGPAGYLVEARRAADGAAVFRARCNSEQL